MTGRLRDEALELFVLARRRYPDADELAIHYFLSDRQRAGPGAIHDRDYERLRTNRRFYITNRKTFDMLHGYWVYDTHIGRNHHEYDTPRFTRIDLNSASATLSTRHICFDLRLAIRADNDDFTTQEGRRFLAYRLREMRKQRFFAVAQELEKQRDGGNHEHTNRP